MDSSAKLYLGIALIIVMIGMGLSLTSSDFKRVVLYPKAVFLGLLNQIVLLPLIAFFIVNFFDLSPVLAVGLMVLAVCPGGPTSNLITFICKGDAALSVTLTAFSSIISLITIPLLLQWNINYFMGKDTLIQINRLEVFKELMMVVLIPVIIGMTINHFKPKLAALLNKPVKIASSLILVIIIVGLCVKESDKIIPYFSEVGLSAFSLNLCCLLLGFASASLFGLSKSQGLTISIETGIQNGTLAIALAISVFNDADYAIPAAVYSLIMFISAFAIIGFVNYSKKSS